MEGGRASSLGSGHLSRLLPCHLYLRCLMNEVNEWRDAMPEQHRSSIGSEYNFLSCIGSFVVTSNEAFIYL